MGSLLAWLRQRGPDWRPRRRIESDVAEELRFHLDEATDEGVRQGLSREAARAAALERFGDVDAIAERCVAVRQEGGAAMLKYLFVGLVVVLAVSALFIVRAQRAALAARDAAVRAESDLLHAMAAEREATERARQALERVASAAAGDDPATWLARFRADPGNWRLGGAVAEELVAALEPAAAWRVMSEVFPLLSVEQRKQALKPFVFHGGHAHALDLLDLAWRDPDADVRRRVRSYLREYVFCALADGDERYAAWRASSAGLPDGDLFRIGLREMVERLASRSDAELRAELRELEQLDFQPARKAGVDVAHVLVSAGFEGLLARVEALDGVAHARAFRRWLAAPEASTSGASDAK